MTDAEFLLTVYIPLCELLGLDDDVAWAREELEKEAA